MVVEAAAGLGSTAELMEYAKDLGRSRNDLYEIPVWKESVNVVNNELSKKIPDQRSGIFLF